MKPSNQVTIKIRRTTKDRWDRDHAEYIGQTGKVISLAEYLDLLQKPNAINRAKIIRVKPEVVKGKAPAE
jgi:hypothetical protein